MGAGAQMRAHTIRRRRAVQGCRSCAALRLGEADASVHLIERERQGLCPLISQSRIVAPVWRASPAGPRQGNDSAYPPPPILAGRQSRMSQTVRHPAEEGWFEMGDLTLMYRACGAESRDDYLRDVANENGLPLACVRRIADQLGEREDFGALILICETRRGQVQ